LLRSTKSFCSFFICSSFASYSLFSFSIIVNRLSHPITLLVYLSRYTETVCSHVPIGLPLFELDMSSLMGPLMSVLADWCLLSEQRRQNLCPFASRSPMHFPHKICSQFILSHLNIFWKACSSGGLQGFPLSISSGYSTELSPPI